MKVLNQEQYEKFWSDGYLVVENVVDAKTLNVLQNYRWTTPF